MPCIKPASRKTSHSSEPWSFKICQLQLTLSAFTFGWCRLIQPSWPTVISSCLQLQQVLCLEEWQLKWSWLTWQNQNSQNSPFYSFHWLLELHWQIYQLCSHLCEYLLSLPSKLNLNLLFCLQKPYFYPWIRVYFPFELFWIRSNCIYEVGYCSN